MTDQEREPTPIREVSFHLADVLERIERNIGEVEAKLDRLTERVSDQLDKIHSKTVELDSRVHALETSMSYMREVKAGDRITALEQELKLKEHVGKDRRGLLAAAVAVVGLGAAIWQAWADGLRHWFMSLFS